MKTRRYYDDKFKTMAVELSAAKGSLTATAEELGITPQILTRWRRERLAPNGTTICERTQVSQEQQEILRLKKQLRQAELDRIAEATRYPKKGGQHLLQERREIFRFIKAHRTEFPVEMMCKVLKVSRSSYYFWLEERPSKRDQDNKIIIDRIKVSFLDSKGRYGSPRITKDLAEQGLKVSRPRVARLMRKASIKSVIQKKYVVNTTDSKHSYPVADNHLNRNFSPVKPGQSWVSDLTYIHTAAGWVYLTIIMDLYDRKVIGWALSESMKAIDTTIPAWQMALKNRPITDELIFHSDRGVQYACHAFTKLLKNSPSVLQSMSGKGNCWDNAVAESFFKTLKSELVYQQEFTTREAAKRSIFEYIEIWYNRQRKHSALGYLSPFNYNRVHFQYVA